MKQRLRFKVRANHAGKRMTDISFRMAAVVGASLVAAISVSGCSPETELRQDEQSEFWKEKAESFGPLGLQASIAQSGSQIGLTVRNVATVSACINEASWPSGELGLDHFEIVDGGRHVPYGGPLQAVLDRITLVLLPGETWTLHRDLCTSYRANWTSAKVQSFWAPFYIC